MGNLSVISLTLLSFAILGVTWFIYQYKKEKRSLWLGISFLAALTTLLALVAFILVSISDIGIVRVLLIVGGVLIAFVLMLFPLVLIISMLTSGIRLIKREGATLSHMLSLGFGIAYILYLVIWPMLKGVPKSGFFNFLYAYLSFCFFFTLTIFVMYTITNILNLIKNPRKKYKYIIVLGSGLKNGNQVTPLLASRIDKGIEAYHQNRGSFLVLSGGKGEDENISESEAMKNYAVQNGVSELYILTEDKSVNTRENLLFSKQVIENHEKVDKGELLVVTTNYHVLRALLLAKRLGIACDGRGSQTKLYFSINAFVREWIAYLVIWRKKYVTILAGGFILIAVAHFLMNYLNI